MKRTVVLEPQDLDRAAEYVQKHGLTPAGTLARWVLSCRTVSAKLYHPQADYQKGDLLVFPRENDRVGIVVQIDRRDGDTDVMTVDFGEEQKRYAMFMGRKKQDSIECHVETSLKRMPESAVSRYAALLSQAMKEDPRFGHEKPSTVGAMQVIGAGRPHSQADFREPILSVMRENGGGATVGFLRWKLSRVLRLNAADLEEAADGKIPWVHRMHSQLKALKDAGMVDSPARGMWRLCPPGIPEQPCAWSR